MLYKRNITFTMTTAGTTSVARTDYVSGTLSGIRYVPTTGFEATTKLPFSVVRNQSSAGVRKTADFLVCHFLPGSSEQWFYPARRMQSPTSGVSVGSSLYMPWSFVNERIMITIPPTTSTDKVGFGGRYEFYIDGADGITGTTTT